MVERLVVREGSSKKVTFKMRCEGQEREAGVWSVERAGGAFCRGCGVGVGWACLRTWKKAVGLGCSGLGGRGHGRSQKDRQGLSLGAPRRN